MEEGQRRQWRLSRMPSPFARSTSSLSFQPPLLLHLALSNTLSPPVTSRLLSSPPSRTLLHQIPAHSAHLRPTPITNIKKNFKKKLRNMSETSPPFPPTRPASRPTTSSRGSASSARGASVCCRRSSRHRFCRGKEEKEGTERGSWKRRRPHSFFPFC